MIVLFRSNFLLSFCLVVLSISERRVLRSPTMIEEWSVFPVILPFLFMYFGALLLGEHTCDCFVLLNWHIIMVILSSLVIVIHFVLKCILLGISIGTLGFLSSLFAWIPLPSLIIWLLAKAPVPHHVDLSIGLLMICQLPSPRVSDPREKEYDWPR